MNEYDLLFWWKFVFIFVTALCMMAYMIIICIKLDARSGFDYTLVAILLTFSHLSAFLFFGIVLSSGKQDQQRLAAMLGMVMVIGSYCSQLLFVIKLDYVSTDMSWTMTTIPFVISIAIVACSLVIIQWLVVTGKVWKDKK